ncbi:sugar-binding domain-containing protein, partial [Streptomyces sp. NPDC059466]|uniref:glycosyl hydrolase 2 galactose-binding domain-containing protein n=1 Tax=Streptomyces sp. NPDC059466 TaxID=3346843 RepID=UPI00368D86BB
MFDRSAPGRRLATAAVVLALLGTLSTSAWAGAHDTRAATATAARATPVPSAAGTTTALAGYAIQSTAKVTDSAADVSSPGYPATGWYPAGSRSTVLAALLADGVYADPFYSTDQQRIPKADFTVPWWYRADFTVGDTTERSHLDFSGVISAADVYVNGERVADATKVAGAYTHHELDITSLVRAGTNTVAFRIRPNRPDQNLTIGWIDRIQPPPDVKQGLGGVGHVGGGGGVALR